MDVRNGVTYANNYGRAAAYFLGTCAPAPTKETQLAAYTVITGMYDKIAMNTEELGLKFVPDVSFSPWEQQKGREKDVKTIRDTIKKLNGIMQEFYECILTGKLCKDGIKLSEDRKAPKKQLLKILECVDITYQQDGILHMSETTAKGLKELSDISSNYKKSETEKTDYGKAYLYFTRCVFEPESDWLELAFDHLMNADGRLLTLCKELEKHGYQRIDCKENGSIRLDFVKLVGKKEEPLKKAWAERNHLGIELSYEELRLEPAFLWLCIPMFQTILEHTSHLSNKTVQLICNYIKNCDGCRYCVQTDKTGTRPLAAINVNGQNKCPRFPGFSFNWRELSPVLLDMILESMNSIETLFL